MKHNEKHFDFTLKLKEKVMQRYENVSVRDYYAFLIVHRPLSEKVGGKCLWTLASIYICAAFFVGYLSVKYLVNIM